MRSALALAVLLAAASASAADAPAKKWKDSAELSIVSTNGNSKTQTTSAKNLFLYQFDEPTALEAEAGALGARSEGRIVSEQYFASEKVTRKLDARNYMFEKYRWDRNVFSGIEHRHDLTAGLGREMWKTPKDLLIFEASPGYTVEQRRNSPRKSYGSARAYAKYTHDFSTTVRFGQDAEYVQSLKDKRDNRINTETGLTAALSTRFSVKTAFLWRHDSRPPSGFRKDDTIFSVALITAF